LRDLVVTQNITLDGVIDASEGWFDVVAEADQTDMIAALREQSAAADAVVFGRVTFEEMRGFWPHQTDDETGVTDYLNSVQKYVFSRTLEEPGWDRTSILRGPLRDDVEALKSQPGNDIVTTGSMKLVADLIAERLIDEYRLFVYPVVLGRGHRLFGDAGERTRLRLVETRPFTSGIVLLRYRTD
jgi:dihydrofolate reductase